MIELFDILVAYCRQRFFLLFCVRIKQLLDFSNLYHHGDIGVVASFLEQIVLNLLQVSKGQVILAQPALGHYHFNWNVELDSSP